MIKSIAASAAAIASVFGFANATTIFTENFEEPQINRQWYVFDEFGNFVSVDGAGIEIQKSGTVVPAFEGTQYVELDSDSSNGGTSSQTNSSMAAEINLVDGDSYRISFAFRPRTNSLNDNGIRVSVGSLDTVSRSFTTNDVLGSADGRSGTQTDWQLVNFLFTAGAGDNAIMLAAFGHQNELGGFVDLVKVENISDVAVPLPAGVLLMGTGLAALARRRRS